MSTSLEILENYNRKWDKDLIGDSDFHKGIKVGYQIAIDTLKFHLNYSKKELQPSALSASIG